MQHALPGVLPDLDLSPDVGAFVQPTETPTPARPSIAIADVRVSLLRATAEEPISMAFADLMERAMVLVAIESDRGVVGYGESWINYPSWAGIERLATLQCGVLPLLQGADAANVNAIHDRLLRQLRPLGAQWGAVGPIMQAISGVNLALWDLLGKTRGLSVSDLFGGRVRERVPVYASSLGPSEVAEMAARCRDRGFKAVKLRLGFGAEVDEDNLRAARKTLGDDVTLLVDVNQSWTLAEAIRTAPMLQHYGVSWVEEPLRGNDVDELTVLAERTGLRLAAGENFYGRDGFVRYLRTPGVEILQPDVAKTGGLSECVPICQLADAAGKAVVPHLYSGVLAYASTLQLAACCPAVEMVELDVRSNPIRDPLLTTDIAFEDGSVVLPDGPGLGVELDLDAIRRIEQPTDGLLREVAALTDGRTRRHD